ncbi:MAG: glucose-1-phosphate thymidylyltransferase [Thermoprotei archaeon]
MKAVILHGGQGTRLRPLTHTGPKQLIKIAGKPISQWGIDALRALGVKDFCIILGDNGADRVVDHYGDGSKLGVNITYVYQGKARGLADAVHRAQPFVGDDNFVVYLGDNVVLDGLDQVTAEGDYNAVLLARVPNPTRFGVALIEGGSIVKLVEKPREPISDLALVGVYRFTPEVFQIIEQLEPSWRGELEITDAIQHLIDSGKQVRFKVIEGWWKDTGTPDDLLEANRTLLDRYAATSLKTQTQTSKIEGRVTVGEDSKIIGSTLRGPTYVGRGCTIKDSFIGPYTSLGDGVQIEGCEVSNSLILDGASIQHTKITDSIIGANAKIYRKTTKPTGSKLVVGENSELALD